MRRNYWSCTKFADWIRGTKKLSAGTSEQWEEWENSAQEKHSVRFWISDTALDNIQNFIMWPTDKLRNIKYYITNRWIDKSYALKASPKDVKRGQWCDLSHRILPCLFGELVEFVEVEQAWSYCLWNDEEAKKFDQPWWNKGWWNLHFAWRCPEAGLAYLDWASKLTIDDSGKLTPQAEAALEIRALYDWWKNERPNRPDPYDESGWSDYCDEQRKKYPKHWICRNDGTDTKPMLDKINEMETAYDNEDTEMMCRLIKVRGALWT